MSQPADPEKASGGGHISGQSNKPLSRPAHALSHQQVAHELDADILSGLTAAEAQSRIKEYGRNELGEGEGVQPLKIVIAQVANAMTMVGSRGIKQGKTGVLMRSDRCSSWPWLSALELAPTLRVLSLPLSSCSMSSSVSSRSTLPKRPWTPSVRCPRLLPLSSVAVRPPLFPLANSSPVIWSRSRWVIPSPQISGTTLGHRKNDTCKSHADRNQQFDRSQEL